MVSLRIAPTASGTPFAIPEGMGTMAPGAASSALDLYISHDGVAKIEDVKLYILPYAAGVYRGTRTAQDDFDDTIDWGDTSYPAVSGGGLYLNMDHVGGFAADYAVFRTGYGDSLANAITLDSDSLSTGTGVDGEIPALGEAHIKLRVDIPAGYTGSAGTMYVDLLIDYTSTS